MPRYDQSNMRGLNTYRYSQPSAQQYESFFNPIPLDFMVGQLDKAQGKYDAAYAGALEAKDQYGGINVGLPDIEDKNRIINDFTNNTDKMVQEQFGGDWGRAAKAVARSVTDVRQNPFWNTSKQVDQMREQERALVTKYGPNALKFRSIENTSVIDPKTGRIRNPDEFRSDIVEKGDWGKTIQEVFSTMKPNVRPVGLSETDYGYLKSGEITSISETGLATLADSKEVQGAIMSKHPEMARAFNELKDQRRDIFGGDYKNVNDAVKGLIIGNTKPMAFSQYKQDYDRNWQQEMAMKANSENSNNPYFASFTKTPVITTVNSELAKHKSITKGIRYDDKGNIIPPDATKIAPVQTRSGLIYPATVSTGEEDKRQQEYYNGLVTKYPELKSLSQADAFKAYENFLDKTESETRLESNLRLEDTGKNIKSQLFSNINSANFKGLHFASTGDVFDRNSITSKLGYDNYQEFETELKDKDISPKIDFREAKLSITVPNKSKKSNVVPETIYFDPDVQTQDMLDRAQLITEAYYNPVSINEGEVRPVRILDYAGNTTDKAVYVEGKGSILDGNDKTIWLIDYTNKTRQPISLDKYYEMVTKEIDTRFNNYQGKTGNPGKLE